MRKKQDYQGILKSIYPAENLKNSTDQKQIVLIECAEFDGVSITGHVGYEMTFFIKNGQSKIDGKKLAELIDKKVKGVCFLNPFQYDSNNNSGKRWGLGLNLHTIEEIK